ncbi:MAG: 16S rRNA (cytosine(1402)-N(4))-methyltransferase [Candidatus Zambryskibacteria bacterium RIFCSPLOWO2_01_FULL_47_33]|nr:MAG: 16S rRNA (cytosine(1402)-N(4))-methyltransferase [Candidatus Zambryskibacteria bacterium RIFCSPLOWO2_01_FULL_47_33]
MPNFAKASLGKHKPVLLHESIEALDLKAGEIFVDATYGGGGHSREVKRRFPTVEVIAFDQDPEVDAITANFRNFDRVVTKKVDAILFDLGISRDQLENSNRGFSFLQDQPLDMRMSKKGIRASDILNSWDEHAIELVLRGFGEEKFSRKIAREIVGRRRESPFQTTSDLVEVILRAKPRNWRDKIHPATKTFQALRIAVNEELTTLEMGLKKSFKALRSNGRFAVISFHSLEDRIVKNFFRDKIKENVAKQITKKPIVPSAEEVEGNPHSHSAKLRVVEKI